MPKNKNRFTLCGIDVVDDLQKIETDGVGVKARRQKLQIQTVFVLLAQGRCRRAAQVGCDDVEFFAKVLQLFFPNRGVVGEAMQKNKQRFVFGAYFEPTGLKTATENRFGGD